MTIEFDTSSAKFAEYSEPGRLVSTEWLAAQNVTLAFSRVRAPILARLRELGLLDDEAVYPTNRAALAALQEDLTGQRNSCHQNVRCWFWLMTCYLRHPPRTVPEPSAKPYSCTR